LDEDRKFHDRLRQTAVVSPRCFRKSNSTASAHKMSHICQNNPRSTALQKACILPMTISSASKTSWGISKGCSICTSCIYGVCVPSGQWCPAARPCAPCLCEESLQGRCQTIARPGTHQEGAASRIVTPPPGGGCGGEAGERLTPCRRRANMMA